MRTYWCEQAWLGQDENSRHGVTIAVDGDRITAVEAGVASAPPAAVRLSGVTVPGFANAHSHAFHRALRGRTHSDGGTFWTWRDRMYELAGALDPDTYEELATATFAEMVLAGYTCVGEFHYLHHDAGGCPFGDPNEMGLRMLRAAERSGIRITVLDTCYLHGGIDQPLNDVQRRFSDGSAEHWVERVGGLTSAERARIGAAIHSVRAVDPDSMRLVARWASDRDAVLHAHVSEQPLENADSIGAYGCSPVELLRRSGALGDMFTAVHATHLSHDDIAALSTHGARCCICATTERDLADGIGPTSAMRKADVELCIGSDSHAVIDPFEETRAIELDERLRSGVRGSHDPVTLLTGATISGYASLGWPAGGAIEPGRLADFVTISLESPRLAGADREDVGAAVVFGAAAADVTDVVIGGDHVVADRAHQTVDVVALLDASIRAVWRAV